jgi:hypothetical protein
VYSLHCIPSLIGILTTLSLGTNVVPWLHSVPLPLLLTTVCTMSTSAPWLHPFSKYNQLLLLADTLITSYSLPPRIALFCLTAIFSLMTPCYLKLSWLLLREYTVPYYCPETVLCILSDPSLHLDCAFLVLPTSLILLAWLGLPHSQIDLKLLFIFFSITYAIPTQFSLCLQQWWAHSK